jgi:acyl-CoA thioesterase FadM
MEGFRFSTDLHVRFSETDAQGVVHNAVYLVWFEMARIAYLGQFPGGYRELVEEHGVDATTVDYVVERTSAPPAIVADGWTRHACVSAETLRPTRMPGWLAEGIASVET